MLVVSLFLAAPASAAVGGIAQFPDISGCISEDGTDGARGPVGTCLNGKALDSAAGMVISPDGQNVYVASSGDSDAVAIFDRDAVTGALTQKSGKAGCISEDGTSGTCADGHALNNAGALAISPDGKNVYVRSTDSQAVAIFDRNTTTGDLTQDPQIAGCISESGSGGCVDGKALLRPRSVAVSPDGKSVYVGGIASIASDGVGSDGVAIFDRSTTTGDLTQKAGRAGCVSEDGSAGACATGRALDGAGDVTISPDNKSAYLTASNGRSSAIVVFDRNTTSGTLTQKSGTAGCISPNGTDGAGGTCADGVALRGVNDVAISSDGGTAYAVSSTSDSLTIFDRSATGALTQRTGTAGCISEDGTDGAGGPVGTCVDGKALDFAADIAISPDGESAYVTSSVGGSVAVFDRNASTGALTQKAGTAGCVAGGGSSGACGRARAIFFAVSTVISPDGENAYVSAFGSAAVGAVAIFDRDTRPNTTIIRGPGAVTNDNTPTFTLRSTDAGSTFECRVDTAAFAACSGPGAEHTTSTLSDGPHTLEARATDPTENTDPTPASRSFTVAKAADVSIQRAVPSTGAAATTLVRAAAPDTTSTPGRIVFSTEGTDIVVTNPGGPGVAAVASGSGFATCTGQADRSRVTCPAEGIEGLEALLGGSNDVVDSSAVALNLFADGKAGNDTFTPGFGGQNSLVGGAGNDTFNGSAGQDNIVGDNPADRNIAGNDTIFGNGGDDFLEPGPGSDLIDGGPGIRDSSTYLFQSGPATITLGDGLCNDGTASDTAVGVAPAGCSANGVDRDLIRNVEFAQGTLGGSDDITGSPANEIILGAGGDDRLEGGLGVDTLLGSVGVDTLVARDGIVDQATVCGSSPDDRTPGDRAVADPDDPVDPSCVERELGPAGTPGPVGTPPPAESPPPGTPPPAESPPPGTPPEFQPTPTPEVTPGVPTTGNEGSGPGGGDRGLTPPELEITSPNATVSKAGIAELRVRCVYLAQACVGEIRVSARKTVSAGKGKKRVTVKKGTVLGDAEVDIPWGTSEPTTIRVSRAVRKLFAAGATSLKAMAEVTAHDGAAGANAADAEVSRGIKLGAAVRNR